MKNTSSYFYLFLLIISACTTVGVVRINRLRKSQTPFSCKTNLLQEAATAQRKSLKSLMKAARLYLVGGYDEMWEGGAKPTGAEQNEQKILFNYNLDIEHIVDRNPAIQTNHNRPTLFLHGWGDIKNSAKLLKGLCDVLPGDVITFNFHDRGVVIPKIHHSSLGQLHDVLPAIYTLKWAKNRLKIKEIDLFGYSRGGATVLNMIAVLNDKNGTYDQDLKRIGVEALERKELLDMIQRGCITLNCPLSNANVSANYRFKSFAPNLLKAFARVGHYQINGLQALQSAEKLDGLKLNILLHFQNNDTIVSNQNEAKLYKRIAKQNPDTTYIVLGNNGGHLHTHAALAHTVHSFRKLFGSSYDPEYDTQYYATEKLLTDANKLLQPGKQAKFVIAQYYNQCQEAECVK